MAHKNDGAGNDKATVKINYFDGVRFLHVDVAGANHTLVESVRNFTQVVARSAMPQPAQSRPLPPKPVRPVSNGNGEAPGEQQMDLDLDPVVNAADDDIIDAPVPEPEASAQRPRKERKPATYKFLDELDLNAGSISFRVFCDQKKPTTDAQRCLVSAAWLKEQLNIAAIGGDHLKTCYRWMKWTPQDDLTSPLRNLKRTDMVKKVGVGLYALTTNGQDAVNNMPKAATP